MPARTAPRTGGSQRRPAAARSPRAFLDLGAVLTAPGCARGWTREILWEWGAAELTDVAELVVSELVTNSVIACASLERAVIRLVLTLHRGELAILVCDDHSGVPMATQPSADDEGGRGLLLVEQVSDRCGWYPLEGAKPAKVTWALISARGQPSGELPGQQEPGGLSDAGSAPGARPARCCRRGADRHRPRPPG